MRRQIGIYKEPKAPVSKPYTFEDWLQNGFYHAKDSSGKAVTNDSQNYQALVSAWMMEAAELDKIQAAQQRRNDYIIASRVSAQFGIKKGFVSLDQAFGLYSRITARRIAH